MIDIILRVNGRATPLRIEARELLLDVLRDRLALTGAKRSCDVQVCGACTVLVDGEPVSACCTLAADAEERDILTIEGFAQSDEFGAFEDAFTRHAGLQCGFCTSGMLLTVKALLDRGDLNATGQSDTSLRASMKEGLSGNLCRCTGYNGILDAVHDLAVAAQSAPDERAT